MRRLTTLLILLLSVTHCLNSFGQPSPLDIVAGISMPGADSTERVINNLDYSRALILFLDVDGAVLVLDRTSPEKASQTEKPLPRKIFGSSLQEQIVKARQAIDKRYGLSRGGKSQFLCLIKPLPGSEMASVNNALTLMEACGQYPYVLTDKLTPAEKTLLNILDK